MSIIVIIPARYASTRLPQKVLADIHGKPMIQHVYERAKRTKGVSSVVIATDHEDVLRAADKFKAEAVMTPDSLNSGTDRVAFVAKDRSEKIVVNIQGDEPLLDFKSVENSIELVTSGRFKIATPAAPISDSESLQNPNVVKVLVDANQKAVYFSRFPIPYSRVEATSDFSCRHHLGIYVYDRKTLLEFTELKRSTWEVQESLEQLRALYHGISIGVAHADKPTQAVDTLEDLEKVRKQLVTA